MLFGLFALWLLIFHISRFIYIQLVSIWCICINLGDHNTVTSCDGLTRSERGIYADFDKIGGPCTCIVTSLFNGYLYVLSYKAAHVLCNNRVIFDCKDDGFKMFNVKFNDTIIIKAEYQPGHTFGRFKQCLVFINYGKYIQIYNIWMHCDNIKSFYCFFENCNLMLNCLLNESAIIVEYMIVQFFSS